MQEESPYFGKIVLYMGLLILIAFGGVYPECGRIDSEPVLNIVEGVNCVQRCEIANLLVPQALMFSALSCIFLGTFDGMYGLA